jgi:hypothetical protein
MCDPVSATIAIAAAAGTAATVYQGNKAASAARDANAQAKSASDKQLSMMEQQLNKVDAKSPDINAIRAGNQSGDNATGTLLTGPGGIDPNTLSLGKNTLLGM